MPELPPDVTLDEVKERARLAGLPIPPARLSMVRGFLRTRCGRSACSTAAPCGPSSRR